MFSDNFFNTANTCTVLSCTHLLRPKSLLPYGRRIHDWLPPDQLLNVNRALHHCENFSRSPLFLCIPYICHQNYCPTRPISHLPFQTISTKLLLRTQLQHPLLNHPQQNFPLLLVPHSMYLHNHHPVFQRPYSWGTSNMHTHIHHRHNSHYYVSCVSCFAEAGASTCGSPHLFPPISVRQLPVTCMYDSFPPTSFTPLSTLRLQPSYGRCKHIWTANNLPWCKGFRACKVCERGLSAFF